MASMSRWNPFRFSRNRGGDAGGRGQSPQGASQSGQQQQQQGQAGSSGGQQMGAGAGGLPQAWLDRSGLPDPLRMISSMMGDPFGAVRRLDSWFGDFSPAAFEPRIDVADRGDAIEITVELPGVDPKDVECTVEDDYVLIEGEKKLEREKQDQEKGVYRVERAFGSFQRVIPLPEGADAKRAEATFDNGTLTIRVPKAAGAASRGRRLEIATSGSGSTSGSASGSNAASTSPSSRGGSSSQQG